MARRRSRTVTLQRALSKLGLLSRSRAGEAIRAGRVRIDGVVVVNPAQPVIPERSRVAIDGVDRSRASWRALVFHKPRGVVTTRADPEGRRTVFDVLADRLGPPAQGLQAVGRLDVATSGLLLLTTDTQLANWIADPANGVPRVYAVTVRGDVTAALEAIATQTDDTILRKASRRESHLIVTLREGRNRQVRRLFAGAGHEVMRLKRIRLGGLELGALEPGDVRELSAADVRAAFPGVRLTARSASIDPAPPTPDARRRTTRPRR